MVDGANRLLWHDYQTTRRNGESDQKRLLHRVLAEGIPAYGLICSSRDPMSVPKTIKEAKADYLIKLQVVRQGVDIVGIHRGKVMFAELVKAAWNFQPSPSNGLDDLLSPPTGCLFPDRALRSGWSVKRDEKVRAFVIDRSAGKCEYCGKEGFKTSSGRRYVEAHHIIALSCQGPDTVQNVIALCPNHHREAHFGTDAERLEQDFLKILAEIDHRV